MNQTVSNLKTVARTANYFRISGFWKDDKSEFSGYLVKDDHTIIEDEDDSIFFYGLSESDIQQAIIDGEESTAQEFVITSYEPEEVEGI